MSNFTTTIIKDNYKILNQAYKTIKNSDELDKTSEFYTSVDTATGTFKDGTSLASKIINDFNYLDMRGNLCATVQVKLKANNHDFGTYYSVDIYMVEVTVDDDSDLYNIVENYMNAGREQIENIISKYQV